MSVQSHLKDVFQDFVNGRFTKSQLKKMCNTKGVSIDGNKETLSAKVIELYSPEELADASRFMEFLRWHERLILSILLSGARTKVEILEHELVKKVFSRGVPEAAFGTITPKILNQRESQEYLSRKVNGLKKKHLLLTMKKGRILVYSIHPWFLSYFKKNLPLPSEGEVIEQIQEHARKNMEFFFTEFPPTILWKTWEDSLKLVQGVISELAEKVEKGKADLRFGLPAVAASSIAAQYYCEKKVELGQTLGREETPEMRLGIEAHERLLEGTIKTKRERVWRHIASGVATMVREMLLLGKYKDIIIGGVADGIYFDEGTPKILVEYKFTKSQRPWRDYHVQARVYCLLLHLMGFNTERLKYALILAPPECKERKELKEIVKAILSNPGKDMMEVKVNEVVARIYVADFEMNRAMQDLDWALGFWKMEREATPTRKAGKCAICEFKQTCPNSIVK